MNWKARGPARCLAALCARALSTDSPPSVRSRHRHPNRARGGGAIGPPRPFRCPRRRLHDGLQRTRPAPVPRHAGYCSEPNLQALKERDIDGYVPLAREGKTAADPDPKEYPAKARMAEKLASDEGRRRYARRKWMAEAPVGWIKEVMGFRRFSLRGLQKVEAEWALVCLALNVKRLHTLQAA